MTFQSHAETIPGGRRIPSPIPPAHTAVLPIPLKESTIPWPSFFALLQRLRRSHHRRQVTPAEGYRHWAASYGREPNALQRLEADAMARLFPDVRGQRILDAGCGKGRLALEALDRGARHAVAADAILPMLCAPDAIRRPNLQRLAAPVNALPFAENSFDTVTCGLVLGHVEDLDGAIWNLARVLNPGGFLLLSGFHPYATLVGWERTFQDPSSRRTLVIDQHLHLFSDYIASFKRHGLVLEAFAEPLHEGFPVVFVLRARKLPPCG